VWMVLGAYALGLPALGASRICQSVLYSRGDTTGPARIAALRMAVAGGIGLVVMFPLDRLSIVDGSLVGWNDLFEGWGPLEGAVGQATTAPHLGAVGLAIGSAGAAWLESALLSHRGRRALQDLPTPRTVLVPLFPAALAAGLVAMAARLLVGGLPDLMAAPLGLVAAGSAYLLVAWRTGIEEAASAVRILRRLFGR
jgi:peptidoglycan biosynthesis protein MviN/MurJ (putative lipid II flippase)